MSDSVVIKLMLDTARFKPLLDASKQQVESFAGSVKTSLGSAFSSLTGIGSMGPAAIGVALAAGITKAASAWREEKENLSRFNAILNATGNAVGLAREEYAELASQMQELTNYDDAAARSAMGVLAAFQSIKGDTFKQALDASADLAAGLKIDLAQAADKVGMALANPERAAFALRSANILLTESEEDLVKSLAESGRLAEAQALILKKVEGAYGGTAQATKDAFTGMKNAWGDMFEDAGKAMEPVTNRVFGFLQHLGEAYGRAFQYITAESEEATDTAVAHTQKRIEYIEKESAAWKRSAASLAKYREEQAKAMQSAVEAALAPGMNATEGYVKAMANLPRQGMSEKQMGRANRQLQDQFFGGDVRDPGEKYRARMMELSGLYKEGNPFSIIDKNRRDVLANKYRDEAYGPNIESDAEKYSSAIKRLKDAVAAGAIDANSEQYSRRLKAINEAFAGPDTLTPMEQFTKNLERIKEAMKAGALTPEQASRRTDELRKERYEASGAKALWESTRTAEERRAEEMRKLDELRSGKHGVAIDDDLYNRGVRQIDQKYADDKRAERKQHGEDRGFQSSFVGLEDLNKRIQAAAASSGPSEKLDRVAKAVESKGDEQVRATKESKTSLDEIKGLMKQTADGIKKLVEVVPGVGTLA